MMTVDYLFAFICAFIIGVIITPGFIYLSRRLGLVDRPTKERKIHKKNIPLVGGASLLATGIIVGLIYYFFSDALTAVTVKPKHLLGLGIGSMIIVVGGLIDDKKDLPAKAQILFPLAAIVSVIVSGIGIDWIKNPLTGDLWRLDAYRSTLLWYDGLPYRFTLLADLFTVVWLMAMMYTTKLLDGLDGLVSGIGVIASVFTFIVALIVEPHQTDIALLSLIFGSALLAFLVYNFNPAKAFLGEGGSLLVGFILGVLSIMSGSKVAVTLIIVAVPMLDVLWTIIRRLLEGKNPFTAADRKHLHHRLLDAGFSVRSAVMILYLLSIIFGLLVLWLQQFGYGLLILGFVVLLTFILLTGYIYKVIAEKSRSNLD